MPKIPTFEAQGRPTAEVGGVKSNVQVPFETSLTKMGSVIADYYVKEKEIASKSEADQLYIEAQTDIFKAKKEAELKTNPDEGIKYFDDKLSSIVSTYSSKASNDFVKKYFTTNIAKERPNYATSILSKTRDNLVTARTDQTDTKIKAKIFDTVHSGNPFSFSILSQEVLNDYQQLEKDGIKSSLDVSQFREKLPSMIETEMVNKAANNNAYAALISLDDSKNFTSIKGEDREKLKQQLRVKAEFQGNSVKFATGVQLTESRKQISKEIIGKDNAYKGVDPSELSRFYTGTQEYDKQIFDYNQKYVQNKVSQDSNYFINDKISKKILNNEINHPYDKFILPGEKVAKSITERVGDGTINTNDDIFLTSLFEVKNNSKLSDANKELFKFMDKVTPLISGSYSAKFFDENYDGRLSNFKYDIYKKFNDGLKNNIPVTSLLDAKSENYIAKDLLTYAPTNSDLKESLLNYAKKRQVESQTPSPVRIKGETYEQWQQRYRAWKSTQMK
jgi:hypothetical protein